VRAEETVNQAWEDRCKEEARERARQRRVYKERFRRVGGRDG